MSVRRRREIWSRILAEADLPRTGAFILEEGLDVIGFIHVAQHGTTTFRPQPAR